MNATDFGSRVVPEKPILFLRIQFPGAERFGPGKAELLAAVDRTGSISEAARALGMSYRRAWLLVDSVNRLFRQPVVNAGAGGRGGGGASLTPFGRQVVAAYRRLTKSVARAAASELGRFARWRPAARS